MGGRLEVRVVVTLPPGGNGLTIWPKAQIASPNVPAISRAVFAINMLLLYSENQNPNS
jgi:hypothetical protein